jgi:hypothetical protein
LFFAGKNGILSIFEFFFCTAKLGAEVQTIVEAIEGAFGLAGGCAEEPGASRGGAPFRRKPGSGTAQEF